MSLTNLKRASIDDKFRRKLASPLRFGDADQIRIMREWRQEIDRFEEEEEARNNPNAPLIRWRIDYTYTESDHEYVDARTAEEAEEKFNAECCYDDFEIQGCEAMPEKKRA